MDNRIFNVNGRGLSMLTSTLKLAFWQNAGCYDKSQDTETVKGYTVEKDKGLILLWAVDEKDPSHQKFIAPLTAEAVAPLVDLWLKSDEAKQIPFERWEDDCDHDGHNTLGWRVYCEDWGHVGRAGWHATIAIKPVYLWHGK